MMSTVEEALDAQVERLMDHIRHLQERLKESERQRADLETRIVGLEALLCDAQAEIEQLRGLPTPHGRS